MCTILKCDPVDSANTCSQVNRRIHLIIFISMLQDLSWDYDFLATSDTVFKSLKLSGTFSDDAGVYPEVLFNDIRLHPNLMNVSIDGMLVYVLRNHMNPTVFQECCRLLRKLFKQKLQCPCPYLAEITLRLFLILFNPSPIFCFRIQLILINFVLQEKNINHKKIGLFQVINITNNIGRGQINYTHKFMLF